VTGWKSLPVLIRLAIWILAVPVLLGGAFWAMLILAALAHAH